MKEWRREREGFVDGKPWRFELLGSIRARYRDGEWLPLPYQKPVALLLYLAAFPHRPHPREALVERLWPESGPEVGRHNLRAALYSLRRLLESRGAATEDLLLTDRTTLRLDPDAFSTDLQEYLAAVSAAERARNPEERRQALGQAAACYTGEFLPGLNEGWVFEERERLATRQREVLQRLVRVREELGDGEGALAAAQERVRLDPLAEEAQYEVMRLYAALGQPSACLRQFQELERLLREELNETPSAQVRALAEELRQGARSLVVARSAVPPTHDQRPTADDRSETAGVAPSPARPVAPSHPSRFPVQLTRFFGRQEEITWIMQTLCAPEVRLVTLTGPGGTGKTRLAINVAGRLLDAWDSAVWFVPLADVALPAPGDEGVPDRIAAAIAAAMGLSTAADQSLPGQVVETLGRQPALLVLDNFEHLVAEGAPLVRTLMEQSSTLTCLVTSRQRLALTGEQEFALLPLPVPAAPAALGSGLWALGKGRISPEPRAQSPERLNDFASVALFVDRARAVRPGFQLDEKNAASVAALCDRLEGLPLALELAAAWVRTLTPAQILERLSRRFELLVGGRRDVAARHQSLRAAIEWSYQLLSPELRRFFAWLSVFRGGWTLEAAEAVTEEPLALSYLHQLQECSLVAADEAGEAMRYRLLETLQEYAWEQLRASGELPVARDRHRDWYRQLVEQAESAARGAAETERLAGRRAEEETARRTGLTIELDNVRAALTCCLEEAESDPAGDAAAVGLYLATALRGFWGSQVYGKEAVHWLEAALARGSQLPAAVRAPALLQTAFLAQHSLERERRLTLFQAARKEYEEVVRLARGEGNPLDLVRALLALADAASHSGDLDATWECCVEARRLLETMEEPLELVRLLGAMARVPILREGWSAARPLLEEQLAICRRLGDADSLIHALGAMGHVERDDGNLVRANALYRESLLLRRELGTRWAVAMSFEDLAAVASRQGQHDRAARLLGAGEALCETMGARPPLANPEDYERIMAEGRAALGDAAFAASWAGGRALSIQQAIDYALGKA